MKIDLSRLSADALLVDFLRLRFEQEGDQPGLLRLYRHVRESDFIHLGWPEETLSKMLESQLHTQTAQQSAMYPDLIRLVLVDRYGPAGRLLIAPQSGRVRLVELSLLPAYQNRGVGSGLMRAVLIQAAEQQCEIRLSIPGNSPAIRFFAQLGFQDTDGDPNHHAMRWLPPKARR